MYSSMHSPASLFKRNHLILFFGVWLCYSQMISLITALSLSWLQDEGFPTLSVLYIPLLWISQFFSLICHIQVYRDLNTASNPELSQTLILLLLRHPAGRSSLAFGENWNRYVVLGICTVMFIFIAFILLHLLNKMSWNSCWNAPLLTVPYYICEYLIVLFCCGWVTWVHVLNS